jgi:hypothetical protein
MEHDKYSYFGYLRVKFLMVSVWLLLMDGYIYIYADIVICMHIYISTPSQVIPIAYMHDNDIYWKPASSSKT